MKLSNKFKVGAINGRKSRSQAFKNVEVGDVLEISVDTDEIGCMQGGKLTVEILNSIRKGGKIYGSALKNVINGFGPTHPNSWGAKYRATKHMDRSKLGLVSLREMYDEKAEAIMKQIEERYNAWKDQPIYVLTPIQ